MSSHFNRCASVAIALSIGLGLSLVLLVGSAVSLARAAGPSCTVSANSGGDYDTIQDAVDDASCSAISVEAGTYNENVIIIRDVTIAGAGVGNTIVDGSGSGDVFRISTNGIVTMTSMTIQNGERGIFINTSLAQVTLDSVEVLSNTRLSDDGPGIKNLGTLTLIDSLVAYNVISSTDNSHDGGGIYNQNGTLSIKASTILSNSAGGGDGGGIYSINGVVTATTSQIVGNTSGLAGGGLYSNGDIVTLIDTTIAGNEVNRNGGGIESVGSEIRLLRSTISGNAAGNSGGGIYNFIGAAELLNVTVSGNSAGSSAGGVQNEGSGATVTLVNTTIASNTTRSNAAGGISTLTGATTTLKHVILAHNEGFNCTGTAFTISDDHNLQDAADCSGSFGGPNDLLNTDPLLAPLADYGGDTKTHALSSDSPAIDAGSNASCPARDQRSIQRPVDGDNSGGATCDIGAYEYTPPVFRISDVALAEGNGGTTSAQFVISLFGNPTQTVSVDYATVDGSATAGSDYLATSDTLTFAAGGTNEQFVLVDIVGETTYETDEVFSVDLSAPTNAFVLDATGLGVIRNDDPQPAISISDTTVTEGDAGTTAALFTTTLSNASAFTVTVDFNSSDDTAVAGTDYLTATGTITFAPGLTQKTITVTVNGDTEIETDETFLVNLSNPSPASSIADGQGVGTIRSDDNKVYVPLILLDP